MQAEKLHKEDGEPLPFSRAQYEIAAIKDLLDNSMKVNPCEKHGKAFCRKCDDSGFFTEVDAAL